MVRSKLSINLTNYLPCKKPKLKRGVLGGEDALPSKGFQEENNTTRFKIHSSLIFEDHIQVV